MTKRSKESENRKNEFIRVSEELFNAQGFENTSVDDIVKQMDVAKGLFYYYFDTKEDLLHILVDRMLNDAEDKIKEIMKKEDMPAINRFQALITPNASIANKSNKIIKYFQESRNKEFHNVFVKKVYSFMGPALEDVIIQGNKEGTFDVKYIHETASAVFFIINEFMMAMQSMNTRAEIDVAIVPREYILERLLGMKEGDLIAYREVMHSVYSYEGLS